MRKKATTAKRVIAIMLAIIMIAAIFPAGIYASDDDTVSIYFSFSDDAEFISPSGTEEVLAMKKLDIPYFDIAVYGLEEYYFYKEDYRKGESIDGSSETADGKVTLLHAYIYALERFYYGLNEDEAGKGFLKNEGKIGTNVFTITGSAGSAYLEKSWGFDENLNYYLNHKYPTASEGWGATCDQILLRDGDVVTVGHFSSWSFWQDENAVFNYLKINGSTSEITAKIGEKLTVNALKAGASMGGESPDTSTEVITLPEGIGVYYTEYKDAVSDVTEWTYIADTDAEGTVEFDTSGLDAGTYLIGIAGRYGESNPDDIVSTPGAIIVNLKENIIYGDVMEDDGYVSVVDANLVYRFANGKQTPTSAQFKAADVDGDGDIDVRDANLVYKFANGKMEKFPIEK